MITIFSITNGRSTHEYSYKSLKECEGVEDVIVVRDMLFSDAMKYCIDNCKTKYFLKADDDFIFNKNSFSYMKFCIENNDSNNLAIYHWQLWSDFQKKVVSCVKIYSLSALKNINGFKFSSCGKCDVATNKELLRNNYIIKKNRSILAIHSMGDIKEQTQYLNLWKENAKSPDKYKKSGYSNMMRYKKSIKHQYNLRNDFLLNLNKKKGTDFWKWLNIR